MHTFHIDLRILSKHLLYAAGKSVALPDCNAGFSSAAKAQQGGSTAGRHFTLQQALNLVQKLEKTFAQVRRTQKTRPVIQAKADRATLRALFDMLAAGVL